MYKLYTLAALCAVSLGASAQGTVAYTADLAQVLKNQGAYSATTTYAANDTVIYNGVTYLSLVASNVGNQPDTSGSAWRVLAAGGTSTPITYGTTAGTAAQGNDVRITSALPAAGGTMTGPLVLSGDPTTALGAATQQYVLAHAVQGASVSGTPYYFPFFNSAGTGLAGSSPMSVAADGSSITALKPLTIGGNNNNFLTVNSVWDSYASRGDQLSSIAVAENSPLAGYDNGTADAYTTPGGYQQQLQSHALGFKRDAYFSYNDRAISNDFNGLDIFHELRCGVFANSQEGCHPFARIQNTATMPFSGTYTGTDSGVWVLFGQANNPSLAPGGDIVDYTQRVGDTVTRQGGSTNYAVLTTSDTHTVSTQGTLTQAITIPKGTSYDSPTTQTFTVNFPGTLSVGQTIAIFNLNQSNPNPASQPDAPAEFVRIATLSGTSPSYTVSAVVSKNHVSGDYVTAGGVVGKFRTMDAWTHTDQFGHPIVFTEMELASPTTTTVWTGEPAYGGTYSIMTSGASHEFPGAHVVGVTDPSGQNRTVAKVKDNAFVPAVNDLLVQGAPPLEVYNPLHEEDTMDNPNARYQQRFVQVDGFAAPTLGNTFNNAVDEFYSPAPTNLPITNVASVFGPGLTLQLPPAVAGGAVGALSGQRYVVGVGGIETADSPDFLVAVPHLQTNSSPIGHFAFNGATGHWQSTPLDITGTSTITDDSGKGTICTSANAATTTGCGGGSGTVSYGTTSGTAAQGNDSRIVNALPSTGGTMSGPLVLASAPTAANQAATKDYVDQHAASTTTTYTNPYGVDTTNTSGQAGQVVMQSGTVPLAPQGFSGFFGNQSGLGIDWILPDAAPTQLSVVTASAASGADANGNVASKLSTLAIDGPGHIITQGASGVTLDALTVTNSQVINTLDDNGQYHIPLAIFDPGLSNGQSQQIIFGKDYGNSMTIERKLDGNGGETYTIKVNSKTVLAVNPDGSMQFAGSGGENVLYVDPNGGAAMGAQSHTNFTAHADGSMAFGNNSTTTTAADGSLQTAYPQFLNPNNYLTGWTKGTACPTGFTPGKWGYTDVQAGKSGFWFCDANTTEQFLAAQ